MLRLHMFALALALVGAPAAAQSVEDLAKQLAAPQPGAEAATGSCAARLPDGTCADEPETRQWVRGGSAAARPVSRPSIGRAATAVRQDIKMTFLLGSAELTAEAKATLDRFARALAAVGSYRPFTVEGHTDSSGSAATNRALSQARAQSVVDYLASRGIDRSRLNARGLGPDRPLPGRAGTDPANRRVEVVAR